MLSTYELYITQRPRPAHRVFRFPGGEAHCEIEAQKVTGPQLAHLTGANSDDLMALLMWNDALRRTRKSGPRVLLLPYLPAARMDRGTPLGAKVYADLINSMDLDLVVTIDPHSDVAPALYNKLHVMKITEFLGHHITWPYKGIIVPDQGARKRCELVADAAGLPLYQASKHRDFSTGKLSSFSCEELPEEGNLLVVDDICDGGGTFLGLAGAIPVPASRLGLWTTHGIYSKGTDDLKKAFGYLGTTDSHDGVWNNETQQHVHITTTLQKMTDAIRGIL